MAKATEFVARTISSARALSFTFFLFKLFIYLTVLDLSYGMQDLVPWAGTEPRPLALEHRVLATGPSGKFLEFYFKQVYQFSSVTQSCPTLRDPMDCSTPGLPVHHQLLELAQTHVYRVGDAIQPSHPLLSPSSPAFNLSQHQDLFQWISSLHQVAKVLDFQLQHQSYQWILGLISFRINWLDLLAVQETFKSLLKYCSSKASILWHSAFFIV